ncbi:MAG: hypothetical protein WCL29_05595, partial [Pseudomonadota bacterium]
MTGKVEPVRDPRALAKVGTEALGRGDNLNARRSFERLIAAGKADASVFFAMAIACERLQDTAGAMRAVEAALEGEPGNF